VLSRQVHRLTSAGECAHHFYVGMRACTEIEPEEPDILSVIMLERKIESVACSLKLKPDDVVVLVNARLLRVERLIMCCE
jgi:hypothetical protein